MNPELSRPALLYALLFVAGCSAPGGTPPSNSPAPAAATTVFVVRHAERASEADPDSPLSGKGRARAADLAEALADAGITAVYTTQYLRTSQTATPLADRLRLSLTIDSVTDAESSSKALAARVLKEHAGGTALVVGHSNTVPLIVRALGGADVGALQASDYENLFIVLIGPDGRVGTVRSRFGPPD